MYSNKNESDKSGLMAYGGEMNFGGLGEQCVADCQKEVRLGFIRKVYGILSVQLLATAIMCIMAMKISTPDDKYGSGHNVLTFGSFLAGSQMFMIFMFIVDIVMLIALFMVKNQYPLNMGLLSAWTLCFSLSVAAACARAVCDPLVTNGSTVSPLSLITKTGSLGLPGGELICAIGTDYADKGGNAVIMAAMITAILFFSLTAFTMQSKWDFSFMGAGLFGAVWILMLWGFFMAIFGGSANMMYMYSLAGAVIFSLYIVYDTWLITQRLGPDDYVMAAIDLYLDIVNLFLFLLQLLRRD